MYRHATTLSGDPDEAFLKLGLVLRALGHFEEAASAFENALKLDPKYSAARRALDDVAEALKLRATRPTK